MYGYSSFGGLSGRSFTGYAEPTQYYGQSSGYVAQGGYVQQAPVYVDQSYNTSGYTGGYTAYSPAGFSATIGSPAPQPRLRRHSLGSYTPVSNVYETVKPSTQYYAAPAVTYAPAVETFTAPAPAAKIERVTVAPATPPRSASNAVPEPEFSPEDNTYITTDGSRSRSFQEQQVPDKDGMVTTIRHVIQNGHPVNIPVRHKPYAGSPSVSTATAPSAAAAAKVRSPERERAPAPVEEAALPSGNINLNEALSMGVALRQQETRRTELEALRDKVAIFVTDMEYRATVDSAVDENVIVQQIDSMLPSAVNADFQAAERAREEEGVQNYADLKRFLKEMTAQETKVDAEFRGMYAELIKSINEALDIFEGTRNAKMEQEFIADLDALARDINNFMNITIPKNTVLHRDAMETDRQCESFESQRNNDDWTEDLGVVETNLYSKVDSVLEETARESENSTATLDELKRFQQPPLPVDASRFLKAREIYLQCQNHLKERVAIEQKMFDKMRKGIELEKASARNAQAAARDTAQRLTSHIKNLSKDLVDAHMTLWQAQKREAVLERSLDLLQNKQRLNDGLAEHEEEETEYLLQDVDAAIGAAAVAEEVTRSLMAQIEKLRVIKEREVASDLFMIEVERLKLVSRKYYKTSLAIFAAESSIEILNQEIEGVLVKKKRSNAAKNSDWVAECNRTLDDLHRKVEKEEARKTRLVKTLGDTEVIYTQVFQLLKALPLGEDTKSQIQVIDLAWKAMLEKLRVVEKEQLSKIELANHLDASFMHGNK